MAACLVSGSAFAYATGQTGYSGKQSGNTCMNSTCHSGGTPPTVTLEGPDTLAAGATGNYTLVIKGGAGVRGGFNVAVDTGSVEAGSDSRKTSGEVTHKAPKAFSNGELRFDFTLVAPSSGGSVKLFGAGNSTNFNNEPTGDASAQTSKTITVTGGTGGEGDDGGGCSAAAGAPLLGAVLMLLGARSRRRK
jgi:predicted CxxxxCH...CXXCH cytochrome family protein